MVTCYDVLEIIPTASEEMIDIAYQTLSMKYDPSRYPGDKEFAERKIQMINKAYGILSDKETRSKYDLYLQRKHDEIVSVSQPTPESKISLQASVDSDNGPECTYSKQKPSVLIICLICASVIFLLVLILFFALKIFN